MFQKIHSIFKYLTKEKKVDKLKEFFSNIPVIETQRLILRRIERSDCYDMFEYSSDVEVTKFLTWKPHINLVETREYIDDILKRYANGKFYDWGLVYKPDKKFIGTCGFTTVNLNQNICEVGYVLSKKYWNKGLITEALEYIINLAFIYFGFDKVEARFFEGNEGSKKVMLKSGMTFEKTDKNQWHVKGEYKTVHTYSITKETYENRKFNSALR